MKKCQGRRIYKTQAAAFSAARLFNSKFLPCGECSGYHTVNTRAGLPYESIYDRMKKEQSAC